METLKIIKVEELKTAKGAPYKKVDVKKADGTEVQGVSAFSFKFPALETLIVGAEIQGAIVIDGNYKNLVGAIDKPKGNLAFKTAQIEKVMDRKEQSIGRFQDDKEWSIMISSTMRDAVSLAIAEIKDIKTLNTLEQDILKWRQWLIENWSVDKTDKPPF